MCGVQQGDPLGPFLFALALQPALKKAAEKGAVVLAYLDDVHICGKPSDVAQAVHVLWEETKKIGLTCNLNKCWTTKALTVDGMSLPLSVQRRVLGVALDVNKKLPTDVIPSNLMKSVANLSDVQIALQLLRYIHNSQFTYLFRLSSEHASQDLAKDMMSVTRSTFAMMLQRKDIPDYSWQQALLPQGPGLGFTNLIMMAPVMAKASILEASVRLAKLDRANFGHFASLPGWEVIRDTPIYSLYRSAVEFANSDKDIDTHSAKLQHQFAVRVVIPKAYNDFFNNRNIPDTSKAIVKTTMNSSIASEFFHAIPSRKELTLCSREMRIALNLLLGIELDMVSASCPGCKKHPQLNMYHALSCKRYGGLILRHDLVKDVLAEICHKARLMCVVEPPQAFSGDKARPDLLIHFADHDGGDMAYDLTIVNPVRDEQSIAQTIKDEQEFLARFDRNKNIKYHDKCAQNGISFCPIVMSAFGGIHTIGYEAGIKFMISKTKDKGYKAPNWAAPTRRSYWFQRIAVKLWAGNVRKVAPFLKREPLGQLISM